MDLAPGPPPAVRTTVLLRLSSEGYEDAFGGPPAWVEAPAAACDELREHLGGEGFDQVARGIGLRPGASFTAGGPAGSVTLAPAAVEGVLGLLGLAELPPDVLVDETPDGPRYAVPDTWFQVRPAAGGGQGR